MEKAIGFNDIGIVSIKGNGYRIYFWYMNKEDSINIAELGMNNADFRERIDFCKI